MNKRLSLAALALMAVLAAPASALPPEHGAGPSAQSGAYFDRRQQEKR